MRSDRSVSRFETGFVDPEEDAVKRILAAGEACFGTQGYAATSMRQIAERAKVSKSLLLYHFQSKEHLFLEVLARIYRRLGQRIAEAAVRRGTPTERALFAIDTLYDALRSNPDFQVQARVWARSLENQALRTHARRMQEGLRADLLHTFDVILGPAAERLPLDREAVADIMWALVTGLGLQAATDPERVERAFAGLKALLVTALEAGRAKP